MANFVFTKALVERDKANLDLDAAGTVIRAMVERDTSTYVPDKTHEFVDDLTGFVEITAAGYSRQTLANKTVTKDDTLHRSVVGCDPVAFGTVAAGQTAKAIILYVQTGGNDSSPSDDMLLAYYDDLPGLPAILDGGSFGWAVGADGYLPTYSS